MAPLFVGPATQTKEYSFCTRSPVPVCGNCSDIEVGVGGNWSWSPNEAAPEEVLFSQALFLKNLVLRRPIAGKLYWSI